MNSHTHTHKNPTHKPSQRHQHTQKHSHTLTHTNIYTITNTDQHTRKHMQKTAQQAHMNKLIAIHEHAKEADATRDVNR